MASLDAINCSNRVANAIASFMFQTFDVLIEMSKSMITNIKDMTFFQCRAFIIWSILFCILESLHRDSAIHWCHLCGFHCSGYHYSSCTQTVGHEVMFLCSVTKYELRNTWLNPSICWQKPKKVKMFELSNSQWTLSHQELWVKNYFEYLS